MRTTYHITYLGDLYEVVLQGHVISRITQYMGGSRSCFPIEYDELPEEVKVQVLDKVMKAIQNED
jgi:hypothetical protein